jgi:hypothetical protein
VRGGDLSCEAETSHVRQRLVVRGGDLSGGPSCRELVGDATTSRRLESCQCGS